MTIPKTTGKRNLAVAAIQTAIACVCLGTALRKLAEQSELEPIAEASGAVLFTPCSLTAIWIAWKLSRPSQNRLIEPILLASLLAICCLARFLVTSYHPTLIFGKNISSYCSQTSFWLSIQYLHWLGFLLTAISTAKFLQWISGIGIRSTEGQNLAAKPLCVSRLALLVTFCAAVAFAYQRWFLCFSAEIIRTAESPTWFQFFPVGSRAWAAGLIGGLLLPFHWLAITLIFELTKVSNRPDSYRLLCLIARPALLVIWCLLATGLNLASSKLYFDNMILLTGESTFWTRCLEYSIGIPYAFAALVTHDEPEAAFYLFKATIQMAIVLTSIWWLSNLGYQVGFHGDLSSNQQTRSPEKSA